MASWILAGLVGETSLFFINGISLLFGFMNTSTTSLSTFTRIFRKNKENIEITKIVDSELMLELRIKLLYNEINELRKVMFGKNSSFILEMLIRKISKTVMAIITEIKLISVKLKYNNSLYIFKTLRKYSFKDHCEKLQKLSASLSFLELRFYSYLEKNQDYNNFKKKENENYMSLRKELEVESLRISVALFKDYE